MATKTTRTAEEITAGILADLRDIRGALRAPYKIDLGAFLRNKATPGFHIDPRADEALYELAEVAGSRSQAVRCWILPALRESPIDGLTVLD